MSTSGLLGAAQVRDLATRFGIRPTKAWGQNFVIDANTVQRIVRVAGIGPDDVVVEVGPGLGSLTLAAPGGRNSPCEVDQCSPVRCPTVRSVPGGWRTAHVGT